MSNNKTSDLVVKALLQGTHHVAEKTWTYNSPTWGPNQVGWVSKSGDQNHGHSNPNNGYYRTSDGFVWKKGK
jgi:hypothetical protein